MNASANARRKISAQRITGLPGQLQPDVECRAFYCLDNRRSEACPRKRCVRYGAFAGKSDRRTARSYRGAANSFIR